MKRIVIRIVSFVMLPIVMHRYGSIFALKEAIADTRISMKRDFLVSCYWRWCACYGAWIGLDARIEGYPILPHGLNGIHISGDARIGKNCIIFHQVTIGSDYVNGEGGAPFLGNVYCGAGAKIIGRISIGNNVRVGANCCIYKDVPANCVAVNAPTRIIQKENLVNRFYSKKGSDLFYYDNTSKCFIK